MSAIILAVAERLSAALDSAWGGAPADLSVRRVVARGEASRVLVDLADTPDDLLVVGAGARGPLCRLWHGRVSRYCLGHASCPVLAIPSSPLAGQNSALRRWMFRRRIDPGRLLQAGPALRPIVGPLLVLWGLLLNSGWAWLVPGVWAWRGVRGRVLAARASRQVLPVSLMARGRPSRVWAAGFVMIAEDYRAGRGRLPRSGALSAW